MRYTALASLSLLVGLGVLAACTSETSDSAPLTTSDAGTSGNAETGTDPACPTGSLASGTLDVVVNGLPTGVAPSFTIPGAPATAGSSSVPAGSYTVTANTVVASDPIVRTVYTATVDVT